MSAKRLFSGFKADRKHIGDGVEIAYVIGGSGPPVLLLHGYPQTKALWAQIAPELAEHFTVVAADLRGYGASSKPQNASDNSTYSFRQMAKDQALLMEALGFERFHMVGHDRGGRTGYRLTLDHPDQVASMTVMDIVPTLDVFAHTDKRLAMTYWHWFFLSRPAPFPETLIGANPDLFFETCLLGWGRSKLSDFDANQMADYRASWHDPEMVHGSCSDYRAGATVDCTHDENDSDVKVSCPTLVMYGADGAMAEIFDIPALWRLRCENSTGTPIPGGHFFIDQNPRETSEALLAFLANQTC